MCKQQTAAATAVATARTSHLPLSWSLQAAPCSRPTLVSADLIMKFLLASMEAGLGLGILERTPVLLVGISILPNIEPSQEQASLEHEV